jgi:hypothetical protein
MRSDRHQGAKNSGRTDEGVDRAGHLSPRHVVSTAQRRLTLRRVMRDDPGDNGVDIGEMRRRSHAGAIVGAVAVPRWARCGAKL